DIRNFLNIQQVSAVLAPPKAVEALLGNAYSAGSAGPEESISSIIESLQNDPDLNKHANHRDTSIDLDDIEEMASSTPVRKLINMVLLMAIRDR
ncbi:hypothetical protein ACTGWZ_11425, partial [Streptococcus suis]